MKNPMLCEHDTIEQVSDSPLVRWCPDCGTQWAMTREDLDRVRELFFAKLAEKYPDHPWLTSHTSNNAD